MSLVTVTEIDHVAYVKLNRPDVRNAFNTEMIESLTKIFQDLDKRKDLRVVALQGEGKVFCAGADLSWMKAMVNYSFEQNREDSVKLFEMFDSIAKCSLPVIAVVQGAAFGGALGLIACCDFVITEEGTQFCFSEVKLGIAPAVISSFVMKKAVIGKIRPLMLSGKIFEAKEAIDCGIVNEMLAKGEAHHELQRIIHSFKECGPEAVRETKKLINDLADLNWEQQKDRTTRLIAERRVSTEGQEGLKSFLEKRAPAWRDQ